MTEYEVKVWIEGEEEKAGSVTVEAVPPLTPMNVKDWVCSIGIFRWREYDRIRFRRMKKKPFR